MTQSLILSRPLSLTLYKSPLLDFASMCTPLLLTTALAFTCCVRALSQNITVDDTFGDPTNRSVLAILPADSAWHLPPNNSAEQEFKPNQDLCFDQTFHGGIICRGSDLDNRPAINFTFFGGRIQFSVSGIECSNYLSFPKGRLYTCSALSMARSFGRISR